MRILRNKLFSKEEKESNKKKNLKSAAIAVGTIGGGTKLSELINNKLSDNILNKENNSELAEKIKNRLIEEGKNRGVKFESTKLPNSVYTGNSKAMRSMKNKYINALKKAGIENQMDKDLLKLVDSVGENKVLLGNSSGLSNVDVLSHELGHEHFTNAKTTLKNVIPKVTHKLMPVGKLASSFSPVVGFASGLRSEKRKSEGKEDSKLNKNIAWALPTVSNAPVLISEGAASLHGYNQLKRLGADKTIKKLAKKRLGSAFGTYLAAAGLNLASSVGSRELGKIVGRTVYKNKKKEEK